MAQAQSSGKDLRQTGLCPGGKPCREREGAHGLLCEAKKQMTSGQVQGHCSAATLAWWSLSDCTGSRLNS